MLCKNMDNFIKIYNTLNIVQYKDGIVVSSSIKQNTIEPQQVNFIKIFICFLLLRYPMKLYEIIKKKMLEFKICFDIFFKLQAVMCNM